MEAIVDVGLKAGIYMTVVEFAIQDEENRICEREKEKNLSEPPLKKRTLYTNYR